MHAAYASQITPFFWGKGKAVKKRNYREKIEMKYSKGLPHYAGWKCGWMPVRATESAFLGVSVWTGVRQAYLEVENKRANLFMSHLAQEIFVGGIAIPFPSHACSGEANAAKKAYCSQEKENWQLPFQALNKCTKLRSCWFGLPASSPLMKEKSLQSELL